MRRLIGVVLTRALAIFYVPVGGGVRHISRGRLWAALFLAIGLACSMNAGSIGSSGSRGGEPQMTLREQDVLMRLWQGDSTVAIAEALGVGVSTVRTHLQHLYVKVGVHSRLELLAYSARHGLLQHYRGLPSMVA